MPKVTIVQVIYNNRPFIEPVFSAIFAQTFKDFNVVAVISGNDDGGKEFLMEKFPQAKSRTAAEFLQNSDSGTGMEIIDPGFNIGFAAGHNLVFQKDQSKFFQLVNPDMIMEPNYVEEMLKAFDDEKVGAATGKLYNIPLNVFSMPDQEFQSQKSGFKMLDTTGLIINKSGRVRDRGQHHLDSGQYDKDTNLQGVCAAGAMYRRDALENVKMDNQYFDSDFHSHYEDVDLSWRMSNAGWKNIYVPTAIGYHARGTAGTVGGYKKVFAFIKYHRKLKPAIREQSYTNHIYAYIKNSRYFYPQFFIREFFMFFYVLFFEINTLKVLPEMFKLLPVMWEKRKFIQANKI